MAGHALGERSASSSTLRKRALALLVMTTALFARAGVAGVSVQYVLPASARTSAGVFDRTGALLRTLWSNVAQQAGVHAARWDGREDSGILAPDGPYEVRVLSDHVRYTWEGVIGNSSDRFTGPTLHHAYDIIFGMAVAKTSIYFATGYNEGASSAFKTTIADPQRRSIILSAGLRTGAISSHVAADDTDVYWSAADAFLGEENSFIYVTRVADDREANLAAAVPVAVTYGRTYSSAIDRVLGTGSTITGLAVERTGPYLFVTRSALNRLDVLNKATGALVRTLQFRHPTALAVDHKGDLWMALDRTTVTRYRIGVDGTLAPTASISGLSEALALAVSPDDRTIAIADGGAAQQVKGFDNTAISDARLLWTLGEAGGYASGPNVSDQKFYFYDFTQITFKPYGTDWAFLAYQPDGKLWVGDSGNDRSERFNADRSFHDRIEYMPGFYSMSVDPNDPSRVFANLLEFHVDYSKPLGPNNDSWRLVRNWGWGVPPRLLGNQGLLKWVATFRNGRTYATLADDAARTRAIVELPAKGNLRLTGMETPARSYSLEPDGSLHSVTVCPENPIVWRSQLLTGFDPVGNPQWGPAMIAAASPRLTKEDVCTQGWEPWPVTASGLVLAYGEFSNSSGWHLEALDRATGRWRWKAAPSTNVNYIGPYPTDNRFDIGNSVNLFAGGDLHVSGRQILWEYHGEKWKNGQTNIWSHLLDDGLMVGQFGVADPARSLPEGAPGMAGNAFSNALVSARDGSLYLYQNDESFHGGIHRWHITGLDTIRERSTAVQLSSSARRGLLGTYYRGSGLDDVNAIAHRGDPEIDFNWESVGPPNPSLAGGPFSVRWEGFIKPQHDETYTFAVQGSGGGRLWVNGALVVDNWNALDGASSRGSIVLEAGKLYPIRLEYFSVGGSARVRLMWSSPSQPLAVVPSSRLSYLDTVQPAMVTNLLDGLGYASSLRDGLYGWHRSPAQDSREDSLSDWWQVYTSAFSDSPLSAGDVSARWTMRSGAASLSRDLLAGSAAPVRRWSLTGQVAFDSFPNQKEEGEPFSSGTYLDILDAAGRVIARLDTKLLAYPNDVRVLANGSTLRRMNIASWNGLLGVEQPFEISADGGRITFRYAGIELLTVRPFDATSDWRHPRTLRLLFWQSGVIYPRRTDLKDITFSSR